MRPLLFPILSLLVAGFASAQAPGEMPGLPAGPATIVGQVQGPAGPAADVDVALYALTPQGHPGIGSATTDATGQFRFEQISNDPGISYLVGARFAGIPFSQRLGFTAGQTQLEILIEVSQPIADTSAIEIASTRIRVDWAGSQLAVRETHVLRNPSDDVIYVEAAQRDEGARPLTLRRLPKGASEFGRVPGLPDPDLSLEGLDVNYWGPFFPGEQELEIQYRLPADPGRVELRSGFPLGTGGVAVAFPATGPTVSGAGLQGASAIEIEGVSYQSLQGEALPPGGELALRIELPELRHGNAGMSFVRTDLFLELDDASLIVNQDVQLEVAAGPPLVASAGETLLRLELPPGAQLIGMSRDAAALGVSGEESTVSVAGPLPAGTTRFGFRYAVPVQNSGVNLDLRFPVLVPTLKLNIADTGDLVVGSNRLHRLRPARSGTRTYLQREAFNVEPGERVTLSLARPIRPALPRSAAIGLLLVAGAAACFFMMRPLQRPGAPAGDAEEAESISRERERVYATIHDLDHDFETGKIAEADYQTMRSELRENAIALLRRERRPEPRPANVAALPRATASDSPGESAQLPTGAYCPSCGERVDAAWSFCSHCGGSMAPRASRASDD